MTPATKNMKTWIELNEKNLIHNLNEFKNSAPRDTAFMAVVKANAYGHGLIEIASVLKSWRHIFLGVDSLPEARIVRRIAKNPVMILGYIPPALLPEALKAGFHISVYSIELFQKISGIVRAKHIPKKQLHLHLKIETGTKRLGIRLDDLARMKIALPIEGLYTHFADSENLRSSFYKEQLQKIRAAKVLLQNKGVTPKLIHSDCTAAAIRGVEGGNLARIGIGLYGLWPSEELKKKFAMRLRLRPVLVWKTRIAQIQEVQEGETIGYDRTYKAKHAMRIAVLPAGYYDGYDRRLSNIGSVIIKGKTCPIVGRICMNMLMVDLGSLRVNAGDEVVLIGKSGDEEISADDLARKMKTINYEIVTNINPLIPRVIL